MGSHWARSAGWAAAAKARERALEPVDEGDILVEEGACQGHPAWVSLLLLLLRGALLGFNLRGGGAMLLLPLVHIREAACAFGDPSSRV